MAAVTEPTRPRSDFSDLVQTHAFGAARFFLPLVLYAVTYPMFIGRYGLDTFALWSLLFSISYAVSAANFGFGDFFTREISKADGEAALAAAKRRLRVARILTLTAGLLIVAALLAFEASVRLLEHSAYGSRALLLTGGCVAGGAILSIQNRLSEAVLRAHYANATVELMQAVKQLVPIGGLLVGVFARHPLELFGLGFLVAESGQALILRRYIAARFPGWRALPAEPPGEHPVREAIGLLGESLALYGLALAMICRDPALRLILVAQYGLTVAGSYEIAYRVGITCFNAANVGASSFLPSLSRDMFEQARARALAKLLGLTVLMASLALAIFGSALALSDLLLPIWIKAASGETLVLCRIMLLWLWFNALIVPAWYYLIAAGSEKYLASAVIVHSFFSLFAFLLDLPSASFLAIWTLAGLIIYAVAAGAAARGAAGRGLRLGSGQAWLILLVASSIVVGLAVAALQHEGRMDSAAAHLAALGGFLILAFLFGVRALHMLRSLVR